MLVGTFASKICSSPLSWIQSRDPCMMDIMDVFAYESNGKISDDDTSSYSSSMEALQCVIALAFVFGLWCSKFDYNLISYAFHIISTIL
jgi:hypothetical protein